MKERDIYHSHDQQEVVQSPDADTNETIETIKSLYEDLSLEAQASLLDRLTREFLNEHSQIDLGQVDETIDSLIEELRESNWHGSHPTKQEVVLEMFRFRTKTQQGVSLNTMADLFSGSKDAEHNARTIMKDLNKKLEAKGFRIERGSVYFLVPFSKNNDLD